MQLRELKDVYNMVQGTFEEHIDWSCDVEFNEPGIFTFQIIQVLELSNEDQDASPIRIRANSLFTHKYPNEMESENLVYFSHINHLVVQPIYQNKFFEFSSKNFDFISLSQVSPFKSLLELQEELEALMRNGYNGFHFSPINRTANSNPSSLLSFQAFQGDNKLLLSDLNQLFQSYKKQINCFFCIDLILSHCSHKNKDFEDKNAFYNLNNTPQLNAAYEVDQ